MPAAFLLDVYPRHDEMILWFATDDGRRLRLRDTFTPEVYLTGPHECIARCVRDIERARDGRRLGWTTARCDFWTGHPKRVYAIEIHRAESWKNRLLHHARRHPDVAWYQADIPLDQRLCFERDIFPLARCEIEFEGDRLVSCIATDDRWRMTCDVPDLRIAEVRCDGTLLGRPRLTSLTLTHDDISHVFDEPGEMLSGFQRALDDIDPDVILTEGGDARVIPLLLTAAEQMRFPLRLDREPDPPPRRVATEGQSLFSYGRVMYRSPDYPLYGRWHLDQRSWLLSGDHGGFHGLFEIARLSSVPVQRLSRRSIGVGLTSMQLHAAHTEGYLIPWKKSQVEGWKTAEQLLLADRGGLVYSPRIGAHERVVELDFASMYPTIMSRFNVSPETVNCLCCANSVVPEIGYAICQRRRGLVSRVLEPIVAKREEFKRLRGAQEKGSPLHSRFDDCASALKWILVCSFGYLGYRMARFGRIEAHETVNAFAREMLLRAKETCEARGWKVLHANVDSVWIVKPGFDRAEIEPLCEAIDDATGLTIALEGIYRWVMFLPSRQHSDRPVPTRFFGAFEDGTQKIRGIEARRHDQAPFVADAQRHLLERLAKARDLDEYRAMEGDLLAEIEEMEQRLRRREVPLDELVVSQSLSKAPEEYHGTGTQAVAARQAVRAGLRYRAGQTLRYIITDQGNADPNSRLRLLELVDADVAPDPVAYIRLLRRAMNTLLWPMGITLDEKCRDRTHRPYPKPSGQLEMALEG